jgi:hypothetical protein
MTIDNARVMTHLRQLADLYKQAQTDKSHHYVAALTLQSIQLIMELHVELLDLNIGKLP